MKISRIKETCIYIKDLQVAKKFYHDKLGLKIINEVEGKHVFFRTGETVLLCFNPDDSRQKNSPPPHYAQGPYHFAFEVAKDEYTQAKEEIISKEIQIIDEVTWPSGLESFYFKDPAGNILEVVPAGVWD